MKILIVGGAGFIGGHLKDAYEARDYAVSVFDIVNGLDAANLGVLTDAIAGHDMVVHLASNADISKAVSDPDIDFRDGTMLTRNVLEAMRTTGTKHLVYASGSGVYGEYHGTRFREDDPTKPTSPYGASKLAGEAMIRAYCHMFGMRADVFRFANVVGPRQTHGVGFDFIRRLKANQSKLRILGDGTQNKSYVHVSDVVAAVFLVCGKPRDLFDVYNVAPDDSISVNEIAEIVCSELGVAPVLEHTGGDRGWRGDIPILRLSTDKIKAMGWCSSLSSASAMRAAVRAMNGEL